MENAFLLLECKELPKLHNKVLLPTLVGNFVSFLFFGGGLLSIFVYENLA